MDNVASYQGGLSSLNSDDDDFLEMEINSTNVPMVLTTDIELVDRDITDLGIRVSSISRRNFKEQPSVFRRTIFAYNYAAQTWSIVDPALEVDDMEAALFDIALSDSVENVLDYLGQSGDNLTFSLRIVLMPITDASDQHDVGLIQLTATHQLDPECGNP
jgi:hypothetical protein